jgi:chromosome segregation ATPase
VTRLQALAAQLQEQLAAERQASRTKVLKLERDLTAARAETMSLQARLGAAEDAAKAAEREVSRVMDANDHVLVAREQVHAETAEALRVAQVTMAESQRCQITTQVLTCCASVDMPAT